MARGATDVRIPHPQAGLVLEGETRGDASLAAVVAAPHPLYGGRLDNPVVVALAEGLVQRGLGVLSFNWRGVGGSGGRASGDPADAIADYAAALAYAKEAGSRESGLVAAGYSFGAMAALQIAATDAAVAGLVLVAPPLLGMMPGPAAPTRPGLSVRIIAPEHDEFCPPDALSRLALETEADVLVVAGADHFFSSGGLHVIASAAAAAPGVPVAS